MQNLIIRANIPYTDPDEMKKKHSSSGLSPSIKGEQRYPQSLLLAALLALLASWIFYMTQSVFGLYMLDLRNNNLVDVCIILIAFLLFWLLFSFVGFILALSTKDKSEEIIASPSNAQTDITINISNKYFIIALLLCMILGLLCHIKNHPMQPISLGMVVILAIVCFWPYFRSHILALPILKKRIQGAQLILQRIVMSSRIFRARGVGTSFAILTKYYPSTKRKRI